MMIAIHVDDVLHVDPTWCISNGPDHAAPAPTPYTVKDCGCVALRIAYYPIMVLQ